MFVEHFNSKILILHSLSNNDKNLHSQETLKYNPTGLVFNTCISNHDSESFRFQFQLLMLSHSEYRALYSVSADSISILIRPECTGGNMIAQHVVM